MHLSSARDCVDASVYNNTVKLIDSNCHQQDKVSHACNIKFHIKSKLYSIDPNAIVESGLPLGVRQSRRDKPMLR